MIQTSTASIPIMSGSATPQFGYFYLTAVSWGYPHLSVFTTSKAFTGYWVHRGVDSSDTTWSPANALANFGGGIAAFDFSIAAVARTYGIVDIFVTGTDYSHNIYHTSQNQSSSWAKNGTAFWDDMGGQCASAPSIVSWQSDRLDLFVLGTDYSVYVNTWTSDAGWTDWSHILVGNWTDYVPTVVSWGSGRIDLFVVEPNTNHLYHAFYS